LRLFLRLPRLYLGGLFNSLSHLVRSEAFDTQLDQARKLLASGYASSAAVVAGGVLETTIKGLCGENGIPLGKLGKMNEDLAKAGVYNKLVQKKVQVGGRPQQRRARALRLV
jgi:hypothetical protein